MSLSRGIEIRLFDSLPDGCTILSTPSHLVVSFSIDQPWSEVLQLLKKQASETEVFALRLMFESYVRERKFSIFEDHITILWQG
jgi:tRNA (Thr-GGU) A37 N-methylase